MVYYSFCVCSRLCPSPTSGGSTPTIATQEANTVDRDHISCVHMPNTTQRNTLVRFSVTPLRLTDSPSVCTPHLQVSDTASYRSRQSLCESLQTCGRACRVMAASRSVSALLLLRLLTGCAAEVGDTGPAQAPAAGGTGLPGTTLASTEDMHAQMQAPVQQPSALAMEPGTYGEPDLPPSFGPSPFPAELEPGAVLPRLCMSCRFSQLSAPCMAICGHIGRTSGPLSLQPACLLFGSRNCIWN